LTDKKVISVRIGRVGPAQDSFANIGASILATWGYQLWGKSVCCCIEQTHEKIIYRTASHAEFKVFQVGQH